jgi:hypothetical protein
VVEVPGFFAYGSKRSKDTLWSSHQKVPAMVHLIPSGMDGTVRLSSPPFCSRWPISVVSSLPLEFISIGGEWRRERNRRRALIPFRRLAASPSSLSGGEMVHSDFVAPDLAQELRGSCTVQQESTATSRRATGTTQTSAATPESRPCRSYPKVEVLSLALRGQSASCGGVDATARCKALGPFEPPFAVFNLASFPSAQRNRRP